MYISIDSGRVNCLREDGDFSFRLSLPIPPPKQDSPGTDPRDEMETQTSLKFNDGDLSFRFSLGESCLDLLGGGIGYICNAFFL